VGLLKAETDATLFVVRKQGRKGARVRVGGFLGVLVCVGGTVLAAGCGTEHAQGGGGQPVDLAAAVSRTQDQTARIAVTISTQTEGMTISYAETGVYDFARSRGMISMQSPLNMTELFLPSTTYIKLPAGLTGADGGSGGKSLPNGKTWLALPDGASGDSLDPLLGSPEDGADPADLLAALTAASSSVTRLGPSVIRGVPVTGFALKIDSAKVATIPGADRAAVEAMLKSFGAAEIPVDVWVDGQNLVRREELTLALPGGSGAPAGTKLTLTTDFYDFGVPVRVSAPPAAQVATVGSLGSQVPVGSGAVSGSGSGSASPSGAPSPPPESGTLTPDQVTSAEQAVTAFWAALGSNNTAAVEATVLPAQRSCVQSSLGSGDPTFTVSALHITSVQPAGNSSATVHFTVKAEASLDGQELPLVDSGPGNAQWLTTTETAGRWYVNIDDSTALGFGGGCD
jgi:hypothetical protein